jgi:hypothetical protein
MRPWKRWRSASGEFGQEWSPLEVLFLQGLQLRQNRVRHSGFAQRGQSQAREPEQAVAHFQVDGVRRRWLLLPLQDQLGAQRHLAVDRHDGPIVRHERQRPVRQLRRAVGDDVDGPQPWSGAAGLLGTMEAELLGQPFPARQRIGVGPAGALAVAEHDDLALGALAIVQNGVSLLEGGGPVAPARGRGQLLDAFAHALQIAAQGADHGHHLLLGLEHRDVVAGRQVGDVVERPRLGRLVGRIGAALVGGAHAERAIDDQDDVAVGPAAEPGHHRRRLEEGPGQGEHQDAEQADAQQHQQQLFEHQPAARDLADLQELHGAPIDDVVASAIEKMDDGRNGQHHQAEHHPGVVQKGAEEGQHGGLGGCCSVRVGRS